MFGLCAASGVLKHLRPFSPVGHAALTPGAVIRFKDLPAGALYKKCGYEVADKDNVLWGLLGQDRRFLLRKRVPGDGS